MGGSPLNNEIWRLNNATKYFRTQDPLTRSHFTNETYYLSWEFLGNVPLVFFSQAFYLSFCRLPGLLELEWD